MNRGPAARLALPALAGLAVLVAPELGAAAEPASWPIEQAAPAANEPRLYILAFSHADISDVAAAVLGTALRRPFDFDPALQGQMDLHVEERLTPEQLAERFSRALSAAGGAVVQRDGKTTLMPAAKARRMDQAERRLQGTVGRLERESASVMPQSAPKPPAQSASLMWLAALAGAGAALAAVWFGSRISFGRVRRAADRREAVIDYLLAHEDIRSEALADARRRADEIHQPLEQTLNQMGLVSDAALVEAYAAVTGCPVWSPTDQPAMTGRQAFGPTTDYMRLRGLAPVGFEPRRLTLAALDPLDDEGIAAAAAAADRPVRILVGAPTDVRQALRAS